MYLDNEMPMHALRLARSRPVIRLLTVRHRLRRRVSVWRLVRTGNDNARAMGTGVVFADEKGQKARAIIVRTRENRSLATPAVLPTILLRRANMHECPASRWQTRRDRRGAMSADGLLRANCYTFYYK
jgi:hypothetical protein